MVAWWIGKLRAANCGAVIVGLFIGMSLAGCSGGGSSSNSPTPAPIGPTPTPAVPTPTPVPTATPTPVGSISGQVNGGTSPIGGSQVTLYTAGPSAYGAGAVALGSAVTNSSGHFTIGFAPPTTPKLLYLVAVGGNGGAGTNSAIGLMGVVGMSDAPANPVTLNELTTVAGEWALSRFFDSTGQQAGSPSSNAIGIENAAAQASHNLVDSATGQPAPRLPTALDCSGGLPPINCDGLKRLNTLGNIIAACVQTSGPSVSLPTCAAATGACDILLACSGTAVDGTALQAAHAIALDPVDNVSELFAAAQGAVAPYQPALIAPPEGFEIALNIGAEETGFNFPVSLVVDHPGNVWITNPGTDSVVKLNPLGRFAGNFRPPGSHLNGPYDLAISAAGDVWVTNSGAASVTELDPAGKLIANRSPAGALLDNPYGVKIDAADNVWVANLTSNSISELISAGNYASGFNFAPAGAALSGPVQLGIDTGANVWVSNFDSDSVSELTAASSYAAGFNFAPVEALFNSPLGLGLDASNNVWVANVNGLNVSELVASSSYTTGVSLSPGGAAIAGPAGLEIDSAGNIWTTNFETGTLSELLAGCSSGSCSGLNFDPPGANMNSSYGLAVDASGNVWVANPGNNSLSEFIGLAAPTGVPALCLKNGQPAACLP
jgi:streptogramin lyase